MDKRAMITTALSKDGNIRIIFADTTAINEERRIKDALSVTCTAVYGRAMTAASIMGSMSKNTNEKLTLQIRGNGPCGAIVFVSDSRGNVRGYIENPEAELPSKAAGKLDVGGAVGQGSLIVIRDLGMNEPYSASCELVSGEIAEDITSYYAQSEQIPTVCALGVRVETDRTCSACGGFIVQMLPGYDDNAVDKLEKNLAGIKSISKMIYEGMSAKDIIASVFKDIDFEITDEHGVEYKCVCSREKYYKALMSLDKNEIADMAKDKEPVCTVCRFCGAEYVFETDGETILP